MKIFISGGAGFIGSHLVDSLAELGNELVIYDNLFRGKLENIQSHRNNPKIKFIKGDIRSVDDLEAAMQDCEIVYHLAAQSNVLGAVSDIHYSFHSNVTGTFNMLDVAHKMGVKHFIFSSSRETYGEAAYLPVDEKHPLNAKNSYGVSKLTGEKYCHVFQQIYDMDVTVLRLSNVYGPRDFNRVIPIFINNAVNTEDIVIYGGEQIIDFVSIEIVINTLVSCLTNKNCVNQVFNVGSGTGTTLFDLADRIKSLLNSTSGIVIKKARSAEVVKFVASIEKFKKLFSHTPQADPLYFLSSMLNE